MVVEIAIALTVAIAIAVSIAMATGVRRSQDVNNWMTRRCRSEKREAGWAGVKVKTPQARIRPGKQCKDIYKKKTNRPLPEVEQIFDKYKGFEKKLYLHLCLKYSVKPIHFNDQ